MTLVIHDDVLGAIGRTPMVRLRRVVPEGCAEVALKLECTEPGGSIKDRAARSMILEAERRGALGPGGAVVEASGGNTGVGLALVCAARSYACTVVVPAGTSKDKLGMLRALGAKVIEAESDYIGVAARLARETGALLPDQFDNPENPASHIASTGPEILEDTGGELDAVVVCIGSGGTLAGLSRFFEANAPRVAVVAAAPAEEGSVIEGVIDEGCSNPVHGVAAREILRVSDKDAITMTRRLAREEGIVAGGSSGLAVCAAIVVARRLGPGKRVVTLAADTGRNYLSTYFDEEWRRERGL